MSYAPLYYRIIGAMLKVQWLRAELIDYAGLGLAEFKENCFISLSKLFHLQDMM